MKWSDSPLVRIGRDGDWFELGRDPEASPALHLWGSEGLGLAPVDIAKSDRITSDGSIVRGVRYSDREVFLPVLLEADSMLELNRIRQGMYDLMAPDLGPVEVQLEIPLGEDEEPAYRSIFGYLTEGLEGKFGEDYYGSWQKLGLTFTCPDPWWLGPEQTQTLQINPGSKPFLSEYQYIRQNLAWNPRFDSLLGQFGGGSVAGSSGATLELSTAWKLRGTTSLKVTPNGTNNSSSVLLMPYATDPRGSELAGKTITMAVDLHLEAAQTGTLSSTARSLLVGYVDSAGTAQNLTTNWSTAAPNAAGTTRLVKTAAIPAGTQSVYAYVRNGSVSTPIWIDGFTVEVGTTDGSYFDGDSSGSRWLGAPGASPSGVLVTGTGVPFFPIVLAESFAQGKWTIAVDGDSDVWPTWEVTGPGTDLLIQRGSERIFIAGEFRADAGVLRIDTEHGRITPDRWADLSLDSRLFPLKAGSNELTVSLANATVDTAVRLVWRERYRGAI